MNFVSLLIEWLQPWRRQRGSMTSRRTAILTASGNQLVSIAAQNVTDSGSGTITIDVDTIENPVTFDTLQLRDNSGTFQISDDSGSTWENAYPPQELQNPVILGDIQLREDSDRLEFSDDSGSTWQAIGTFGSQQTVTGGTTNLTEAESQGGIIFCSTTANTIYLPDLTDSGARGDVLIFATASITITVSATELADGSSTGTQFQRSCAEGDYIHLIFDYTNTSWRLMDSVGTWSLSGGGK